MEKFLNAIYPPADNLIEPKVQIGKRKSKLKANQRDFESVPFKQIIISVFKLIIVHKRDQTNVSEFQ